VTSTAPSGHRRGATPAPPASRTAPDRALPNDPHPGCVVCGRKNARGLHLDFTVGEDGSVEGRFPASAAFEGYPRQLHGGVIAMLLDGAMTNCLFCHGHVAQTGELTVRYRRPVAVDRPVTVRAWIGKVRPPLRRVAAELVQDGTVMATGAAKFIDRPASDRPASDREVTS
jgi:acyl-coenzyme A thioesterase PaaI-like protein